MHPTIQSMQPYLHMAVEHIHQHCYCWAATAIIALLFIWLMLPIIKIFVLLYFSYLRTFIVTFIPIRWRSKNVKGQICLVTGGGQGIGLQMAKLFSAKGCKIVLVDINKDTLVKAAEECKQSGAELVNTYVCDISNREKTYEMTKKVLEDLDHVDILVNNAGIVSGKPLLELDDERNIERIFKINVICHFWLIKAFLPKMLERNNGHIVTVASMAGIMNPTTHMIDYASTKFAAVGLGETLEYELRYYYQTDAIKHTLVCPYFISTGMFHGVSLKYQWLLPYMTPQYVAQKVVDAVLTNKAMVMLPPWLYLMGCIKYLVPNSFRIMMAEYMGTTGSMSTWQGHKTN